MTELIFPEFQSGPCREIRPCLSAADKPPEKWTSHDAAEYFATRFRSTWPGEGAPAVRIRDLSAIKHRFGWLQNEKVGAATMKRVIEHIFDHWSKGLPTRLRWNDSRPGLALIEHCRLFERLVREVQNGVPRKRITGEYDPEKFKDQPTSGWGKL